MGVCTDGAKSMTGKFSGFVARVKKIKEKIQETHCCIHRQALVCKRIPAELSTTLSDAVKIVNFIKSRATIAVYSIRFVRILEVSTFLYYFTQKLDGFPVVKF